MRSRCEIREEMGCSDIDLERQGRVVAKIAVGEYDDAPFVLINEWFDWPLAQNVGVDGIKKMRWTITDLKSSATARMQVYRESDVLIVNMAVPVARALDLFGALVQNFGTEAGEVTNTECVPAERFPF